MHKDKMYENGTYLENNPGWHEEDSSWKASNIEKILDKNEIHSKSICEIGCGAGEILNQLSKNLPNRNFTGYEISPQAFEICKNKSGKNLRFFNSNIFDSPDLNFDIAMAIDVFEHVEDYMGFLRNMKKVGKFKVYHIPLDLSVQSVLRASPIMKARKNIGHIHYFTKETALASLQDTGHIVIDCIYTATGIELPNRGWKADLMKLPRRLLYAINPDLAARILGGYSLLVLTE